MPDRKSVIRVNHPGAFEPDVKDVPEKFDSSVTVAGSHTIFFLRKPTENQLSEAVVPNGEAAE